MIKITVLYPSTEGATFDFDYFVQKHIPLMKSVVGDRAKTIALEKGLAGGPMPGTPAPFLAMAHLYFETMDDFAASMAQGAEAIMNDIPNYTNAQPVIQIAEVLV